MDDLKKAIEESMNPLVAKFGDMESRLAKMEALPILQKAHAYEPVPTIYKGRRISKQGLLIRELVGRDPKSFDLFRNEQKIDEFCKFMLDVITRTALAEGGATTGATLVPDEFQMELIQLARNSSFALQNCRNLNMNTDTLYVPTETAFGSMTWESEAATKTASEPTFSNVQLTAKKLFGLAVSSNEMLQDSAIDIVSILTEQFAYNTAQELDNQVLNGTGDPVSGVLTAKAGYSVVLSGASMSALTAPDLSLAISKLQEGYTNGAQFVVGRLASHYLRALKDSQSRPIYNEVGGGMPPQVYGFSRRMSEKITNTDAASVVLGVFGNFRYFLLANRLGAMSIEVDPYSLFTKYQTQFRMVTRWGMAVGQAEAFCRIMASA